MAGDFVHGAGELVVQVAIEGIEFLGDVEGDDGDFAFVVDEDAWFGHGDGGFWKFNRSIEVNQRLLGLWSDLVLM